MLNQLERLAHRRALLEEEIDGLVAMLRSMGLDHQCAATWQQVGDALGVTKQAAQQAYSYLSWAG